LLSGKWHLRYPLKHHFPDTIKEFTMPHVETNIKKKTCLTCHFFQISRRVRALNAATRIIEFDDISGTCTLLKKRFEHSRNSETTPPYGCAYKRWYDLP